ncbi:lysosome-associated membrane glycoprotein 2 [Astyanax mexicanus]|uniref:Lysosome-associated membrane glycoprotein 2 n=1 Tax=Astyanax mexicanus TaxID=7994 RepID=A0A8T2LV54_ASTMX|nr:lysosome-associated membrane glycoprotein 2 [Astyanax mexicanus]
MFRCVCLPVFVALLSGLAHAQLLLSTPESLPTGAPAVDETDAPSVAPTTPDFANTVTDSTTTDFWASSATSTSPSSETSVPAEPDNTNPPTTEPTQGPTPSPTNATTVIPTNATTVNPTNATTVNPTNATTVNPTNATTVNPTNATTVNPTNATTVNPTNATTVNPTNASTTAVPTTPPPIPNPSVGDYNVGPDPKSVCLKAKMGLQFRYKLGESFQTINLDPNVTHYSGLCGNNGSDSTLSLKSELITVQFLFVNQSNKFHLGAMNFTLSNGNETTFDRRNSNMSLWEASLGSSYMCRKEQTFNISDDLVMNTFELQVQPFGVTENKFSTAEECFLDADLSFLVPIAVGVALGFLIILVLISYLIGRRKSRTGYQSV